MASSKTASGQTAAAASPAQLEREIAERRDHLAATVDELLDRVKPASIANRTMARAQAASRQALRAQDGSLRVERLAAVGVAVSAVVGLAIWQRLR